MSTHSHEYSVHARHLFTVCVRSLTGVCFLLQTWEDPNFVHPDTQAKGDKDPLDVVEIGDKIHPIGSVITVSRHKSAMRSHDAYD